MKHRQIFFSSLVLMIMWSCSSVPISNRRQLSFLPDELLVGMSLTQYNDFLSSHKVLVKSDQRSVQVERVGKKIAAVVEQYMRDNGMIDQLNSYQWAFNTVEDNQVNAWCMPGGKVVVYTGILPLCKDDTGLAVVLGHEIAHAIARHGNERMSQQMAVMLGGISLEVAMKEKPEKTKDIFRLVYGAGSTLGTLAYSRTHEYEADKLGLVFMAMAGYQPQRAVTFWSDMAAHSNSNQLEFLSTHPSNMNRIKAIEEYLPQANKYYKN